MNTRPYGRSLRAEYRSRIAPWAIRGLAVLAFVLAPFLLPSIAVPGLAVPGLASAGSVAAHALPCEKDCIENAEVTVTVPAREDDPVIPPPVVPPPVVPPPAAPKTNTTSWGTNAPKTTPPPSTTNPGATPPATAPKVDDAPKQGVGKAEIRGEEKPGPGVSVTVYGAGFAPGEKVQVVLFGKPPVTLGSFAANAEGIFEHAIELPKNLLPGEYTVELTGHDSGHVLNVKFKVAAASWASPDDSLVWMWWVLGGIVTAMLAALGALILLRHRASAQLGSAVTA